MPAVFILYFVFQVMERVFLKVMEPIPMVITYSRLCTVCSPISYLLLLTGELFNPYKLEGYLFLYGLGVCYRNGLIKCNCYKAVNSGVTLMNTVRMTMDEVLTFNICLCEGPGVWNGAGLAAFGGKGKKLSIIQLKFFLKCHLNWLWSHCDDQLKTNSYLCLFFSYSYRC